MCCGLRAIARCIARRAVCVVQSCGCSLPCVVACPARFVKATHARTRTHTHARARALTHTHARTHTYTHTLARTHTHTNTRTHTARAQTHAHARARFSIKTHEYARARILVRFYAKPVLPFRGARWATCVPQVWIVSIARRGRSTKRSSRPVTSRASPSSRCVYNRCFVCAGGGLGWARRLRTVEHWPIKGPL